MQYKIIIEPDAEGDLQSIFNYIKDNDSQNQAKRFIKKLQTAINSLSFMPNRCRDSLYMLDEKTKDLIYHGYTICYHISKDTVYVVAIFRQK